MQRDFPRIYHASHIGVKNCKILLTLFTVSD